MVGLNYTDAVYQGCLNKELEVAGSFVSRYTTDSLGLGFSPGVKSYFNVEDGFELFSRSLIHWDYPE